MSVELYYEKNDDYNDLEKVGTTYHKVSSNM